MIFDNIAESLAKICMASYSDPAMHTKPTSDSEPVPSQPDWKELASRPAFRDLLSAKARFIVPALIFFMVFYLALPILVGYWPDLMKKKIWGEVNVAYLFALSQFFMAWTMAFLYVKVAAGWDKAAAVVIHGQE